MTRILLLLTLSIRFVDIVKPNDLRRRTIPPTPSLGSKLETEPQIHVSVQSPAIWKNQHHISHPRLHHQYPRCLLLHQDHPPRVFLPVCQMLKHIHNMRSPRRHRMPPPHPSARHSWSKKRGLQPGKVPPPVQRPRESVPAR